MKSISATSLSVVGIPNSIHNFDQFLDLPLATKIIGWIVTDADDNEDNVIEFLIAYQVGEIRLHLEMIGKDCTKLSQAERELIYESSVDYISENIVSILGAISPKSLERLSNMVEARRQELRTQHA